MVPGRPFIPFVLLVAALAGCLTSDETQSPSEAPSAAPTQAPPGTLRVSSGAFRANESIPREYTCDGENVSPSLNFTGFPSATVSFALIMEDPDAPSGTVLHWTFWNVPKSANMLPRAADVDQLGGREGRTYRGPCPPVGPAHRYFFYGYAVDANLELATGASVTEMRDALKGHVLAEHSFYGLYSRLGLPPMAN